MPHETQKDIDRGGAQIGVGALLITERVASLWGVKVPRIERGVVGQALERLEAFEHRARVAARQIDPATTIQEKRIPGHEMSGLACFFHEKTLTAGGMAGRVDESNADAAEFKEIAALVLDHIRLGNARHLDQALDLVFVGMNRNRMELKKRTKALDRVAKKFRRRRGPGDSESRVRQRFRCRLA